MKEKMVQSRLVSSLLAPALRLWLRSQVESIESLDINIEGGDRQILGGHIPKVSLQAEQAVYQGLYLSQLAMTASTIRINIGQVVRGKSFRLLAPIPVETTLQLDADGLAQSASAPLLRSALIELWHTLCRAAPELGKPSEDLESLTLNCGDGYLDIYGGCSPKALPQDDLDPSTQPFMLRSSPILREGHRLEFRHTHLSRSGPGSFTPFPALDGFQLDLGRDITLNALEIKAGGIHCQGTILVMP